MYHISHFRQWVEHVHWPGHRAVSAVENLFQDRRFLVVLLAVAIMALVVWFLVWVGGSAAIDAGETNYPMPLWPYPM